MILSPNSHRKAENKPLLKNIPHLIGQKMGKIHPSIRIVYFLFTKIDSVNKKCAFRRIINIVFGNAVLLFFNRKSCYRGVVITL